MYNPIRRNRNIGTAKQGYGQNNKFTIPEPCAVSKSFFERLGKYEKVATTINGHEFVFVIEQTIANYQHACTVNDIEKIIAQVPPADYGELKLVILRQPKRKEALLSPVWGRLIYSYEFEEDYFPAIIIEAQDYTKKFKWPKGLSVESQKELERLKADGHPIQLIGRFFTAPFHSENVRSTQLYRTLLHEFGHYVHYLQLVTWPGNEDESIEEWEIRYDRYFKISKTEKEQFAHRYADTLRQQLIDSHIIPFNQL